MNQYGGSRDKQEAQTNKTAKKVGEGTEPIRQMKAGGARVA